MFAEYLPIEKGGKGKPLEFATLQFGRLL